VGFFISNSTHKNKQNMNKDENMTTYLAEETRFNPVPTVVAPFRATLESDFEKLKARLLKNLLNEKPDPVLNTPLRRAANEAAGLAWLTPFPMLFYPALLDEKAATAAKQYAKQREIHWNSPRFMEKAA
jgi:hypothetical protein